MRLVLTIVNAAALDNGQPVRLVVDRRSVVIGRSAQADWRLPDATNGISGSHCEISYDGERYVLADRSVNGTFMNGSMERLARPTALNPGDEFRVGAYRIIASLEAVEGPPGARRHDVFISYSHHNQSVVDAMASLLERDGVRCWYAARDITGGEEWAAEIMGAINQAGLLVLVFSGHSNASHQVRREMDLATSRELPIIPFRIEDVEPHPALRYYMAGAHWMDALTPPLEARIRGLSEAAQRLLARPVPKSAASEAAAARFVAGIAADAREDAAAEAAPRRAAAQPAATAATAEAPVEALLLEQRARVLAWVAFALIFLSIVPIFLFGNARSADSFGPIMLGIAAPLIIGMVLLFIGKRARDRATALRAGPLASPGKA